MSSNSRQQLEVWLKKIDVKVDSVLDVGGSQNPMKGRTKSWDVKEYKILDLAEPHEVKQEPDLVSDLNDLIFFTNPENKKKNDNDIGIFELEKYDIVFCIEVAEYWYNPRQALYNLKQFLKEDGILYISFHFLYPVHNPVAQDYLRYTQAGVDKLLKEAGFQIENVEPRILSAFGFQSYKDFMANERMRPSKDFSQHMISGSLVKAKKL